MAKEVVQKSNAGVSPALAEDADETSAVHIEDANETSAVHIEDADGTSAVRGAATGVHIRDRGYLPHWTAKGAIYHVTFRLHDALPAREIERIEQERETVIRRVQQGQCELTESERKRLKQLFNDKIDRYLDNGRGICYLANSDIADMLASVLRHFDGKRYELYSWCIMPNHVHAVVKPWGDYSLSKIFHSWKSYSAHEANKIMDRKGSFWSEEYYDHLIRDENEFFRTIKYIMENPVEAGLVDWPWVFQKVTQASRLH